MDFKRADIHRRPTSIYLINRLRSSLTGRCVKNFDMSSRCSRRSEIIIDIISSLSCLFFFSAAIICCYWLYRWCCWFCWFCFFISVSVVVIMLLCTSAIVVAVCCCCYCCCCCCYCCCCCCCCCCFGRPQTAAQDNYSTLSSSLSSQPRPY